MIGLGKRGKNKFLREVVIVTNPASTENFYQEKLLFEAVRKTIQPPIFERNSRDSFGIVNT